jgi:hypothetical protein
MKQKNDYFKFKQTRIVVPPLLFSLFLLFFFTNNTVRSQALNGKCFRNSFGSHALIVKQDYYGGFEGFYGSSTGSAGVFRIIGKTPENVDMSKSFPVTFTIGWGTLKDKPGDASQYWSSTMSGSYDPNQQELNLLNVISAPGAFDAVSIFNPGNLPQSQLFTTVKESDCDYLKGINPLTPSDQKSQEDKAYENLLEGTWKVDSENSFGLVTNIHITNLEPKGNSYSELRYYKVRGDFILSSKEVIPFEGIASPYLPEEKNDTDFSFALSLVGTVNPTDGKSYNISLSGVSSGDGSRSINMFLTKSNSMSSDKPEIDDNQISTGEIFIKN